MDLFSELQSEGFADSSTAAFTAADTHGNRFAKTALPNADLSTKELVVEALAALGNERISCSLAYKVDHDGKKVTVGKADRGTVPADKLAQKWGAMVGAAVAVDEAPEARAPKRTRKAKNPANENSATEAHASETAPVSNGSAQ